VKERCARKTSAKMPEIIKAIVNAGHNRRWHNKNAARLIPPAGQISIITFPESGKKKASW